MNENGGKNWCKHTKNYTASLSALILPDYIRAAPQLYLYPSCSACTCASTHLARPRVKGDVS